MRHIPSVLGHLEDHEMPRFFMSAPQSILQADKFGERLHSSKSVVAQTNEVGLSYLVRPPE